MLVRKTRQINYVTAVVMISICLVLCSCEQKSNLNNQAAENGQSVSDKVHTSNDGSHESQETWGQKFDRTLGDLMEKAVIETYANINECAEKCNLTQEEKMLLIHLFLIRDECFPPLSKLDTFAASKVTSIIVDVNIFCPGNSAMTHNHNVLNIGDSTHIRVLKFSSPKIKNHTAVVTFYGFQDTDGNIVTDTATVQLDENCGCPCPNWHCPENWESDSKPKTGVEISSKHCNIIYVNLDEKPCASIQKLRG